MTPSKIQERLTEVEGRVDAEEYVRALQHVRGIGERRER